MECELGVRKAAKGGVTALAAVEDVDEVEDLRSCVSRGW
jgi:hypothetical protein